MSREIKFRGKNLNTELWVYGFYSNMSGESKMLLERGWNNEPDKYKEITFDIHLILSFILPDTAGWDYANQVTFHKVNPNTVGQFTGLQDKNGVEIFEGDVINIQLPLGGFWGDIKKEKTGVVKYESDYAAFIVEWNWSKNQHHEQLGCDIAFDSKVIGNIHQNPELLKT